MPLQEALRVEHLTQTYQAKNGETAAINDLSFSVKEGEFVSIVGPSGCGKSTLLSIISGLLQPTSGSVQVYGEPVTGITPRIAYMLQRDYLLPWRTIWRNVIFGLQLQGKDTSDRLAYAEDLLKTYGLYEFRNSYPAQLSGGMRQRAALIRTLAMQPDILLLDEAFSALDYQTRLTVSDDVYRILRQENKTILMVTHDIPESISMSDRILVLSARPCQIKSQHEIRFDLPERSPLLCRNQPEFSSYFNLVWKELDVYVE